MLLGLEAIPAEFLVLAATGAVSCTVPKAPAIRVMPASAPIQYEYNLTSAQLEQFRTGTVSPYAPGTDTTTGGLRHDRPEMKIEVKWGERRYERQKLICLWYDAIEVTIDLKPKIYIAKDTTGKSCRQAIMEHEIKHVNVDREVMNRYARSMGDAIKKAVDGIGAMGPYNDRELPGVQKKLVARVKTALEGQKTLLHKEMAVRQAEIDSLAEYERVSAICNKERKK